MNTLPLFHQLRTAITPWVELPEPEWHKFAAIFQIKSLERREYLTFPGTDLYELIFVNHGLLRFYYPAENGTESNKAFVAENSFAGPIAAFAIDRSILYGVQALEPTTLLTAKLHDFTLLFDQHPLFDRLGRKLLESLLIHKELRARSLQQKDGAERYLEFLEHFPQLAERVPQYHIASYLGISEVSLSRIKRKLSSLSGSK